MKEIQNWLVEWFCKNTDATKETIETNIEKNYFEMQWIDSFSFINFITDLEDKYPISFSNDEFQNRDFATISGLAKIIKDKTNA